MAKKTFQLLPEPASKVSSSAKLQIDVPPEAIAILDEAKRLCGLSRKALIAHLFCNVLTPMLQDEIERRKNSQSITQSADRSHSNAPDLATSHAEVPVQNSLLMGGNVTADK